MAWNARGRLCDAAGRRGRDVGIAQAGRRDLDSQRRVQARVSSAARGCGRLRYATRTTRRRCVLGGETASPDEGQEAVWQALKEGWCGPGRVGCLPAVRVTTRAGRNRHLCEGLEVADRTPILNDRAAAGPLLGDRGRRRGDGAVRPAEPSCPGHFAVVTLRLEMISARTRSSSFNTAWDEVSTVLFVAMQDPAEDNPLPGDRRETLVARWARVGKGKPGPSCRGRQPNPASRFR